MINSRGGGICISISPTRYHNQLMIHYQFILTQSYDMHVTWLCFINILVKMSSTYDLYLMTNEIKNCEHSRSYQYMKGKKYKCVLMEYPSIAGHNNHVTDFIISSITVLHFELMTVQYSECTGRSISESTKYNICHCYSHT